MRVRTASVYKNSEVGMRGQKKVAESYSSEAILRSADSEQMMQKE